MKPILIHDILNLSRLQSGQFEFKKEEFDLIFLIKTIIRNLESKLEGRRITIKGVNSLSISSDEARIEEVIINLLSNAIKFSDTDSNVEIKVDLFKNKVRISIQDEGIGIPQEEQNYIWGRFHQVDRARTPNKEGTGLGLAIVKEIIEGLGGEVGVKSELGVGSEFYFIINI